MAPVTRGLRSRVPRLNFSPFFQCCLTSTILVTFLVSTCAGIGKQFTLTSPQFPNLYPIGKRYVWEIITAPQDRINLTFNVFDLEDGTQEECIWDNVVVSSLLRDGETHNHGKFCGSGLPPPIISTTNRLRIEFISDASKAKTGFSAVYSAGTNASDEFEEWKGIITSPLFPDYYPKNTDYTWEIISGRQEPTRMTLNFTYFDLQPFNIYCYDYVEYGAIQRDGHAYVGQMYPRLKDCGYGVPQPMTVDTDHIHVEFHSNAERERPGFRAVYSTVLSLAENSTESNVQPSENVPV